MVEVVVLSAAEAEGALAGLADLLSDCVAGGASLGYMSGITRREAEGFWRTTIIDVGRSGTILFAARSDSGVVGCVLLQPISKPNQPHRADVAKLLVISHARRLGVASRLMERLEEHALRTGRWLLTLDTATGSEAEHFYRQRGYQRAGVIPGYCLMPDGRLSGTTFYYKQLT
jgi:GNAT superfamily N-acetyltransferase